MIIPLWMRALAAAIILSVIVGIGWSIHHTIWKSGYNKAKAEQALSEKSAIAKRLAENAALAKQHADKAKQESENHAKELDAVRAAYRRDSLKRVPIPADFCRPAGKDEASKTGSDGQENAGAAFLPEPFVRDLRELAADADEVAADLRSLKKRAEESGCFQ